MKKDINQSLYDTLFRLYQEHGSVYASNPPQDEPYPFIHLGMIQIIPRVTKSHWMAIAEVTVDVWGDSTDRGKVSSLANQVVGSSHHLRTLESGHDVRLIPQNSTIELMVDQSTASDLWRAIVRLQFEVN